MQAVGCKLGSSFPPSTPLPLVGLGTPVVPFSPFLFSGLPIKAEHQEKGTLIILGLLG